MPFIPPDVTTEFENWTDPALPAWQATNYDGTASTLTAVAGQGAVSAEGGALTVASDSNQARLIPIDTAGGGYIAWFFRWQNTTNFYWFILQGTNWKLRRMVSGVASDLATTTGTYSSGDILYFLAQGTTFELYQQTGGIWNETAVLSGTDATFASGPSAITLGNTAWRLGSILDVDTDAPTAGVTIYVDADHPDADDARTRTQASDPDTPLATMQRAAALAQAGASFHDTISVKYAENADPANPTDPRMYAGIAHRVGYNAESAPTLAFGDNTGNQPIIVQGVAVSGQFPVCRGFNGRYLRNWVFQDFQSGYDRGSGNDYAGLGELQSVADLVFRRIDFTSGAHQVAGWTGTIEYDDCDISSPLSPSASLAYDGRGIGFSYLPAFGGGVEEAGLAWVHDCRLTNIRGNDGINAGIGGVGSGWEDAHLLVEDCLFHNVTEGADNFHTDSIQALGGQKFTVRRNAFIGCSNALMASDFHNGTIEFDGNLSYSGPGQVQIQGTDTVKIRHNTLIDASARPDATIIFFTRFNLDTPPTRTIVNNVLGDIQYRQSSAAIVNPATVISRNLRRNRPTALDTGYGTEIAGIPEFGTSARMAGLPTTSVLYPSLPANYELANTIPNPALAAGLDTDFATDRLGRTYPGTPDVGCHQSDPGTPVTPAARAPYVITLNPADTATGVTASTDVTATIYPKPGETLEPDSISGSSAYVTDAAGNTIPALITVGAPDGNGYQTVTLNLKASVDPLIDGDLYPLATYTARLTGTIVDTEGSPLALTAWTFRIAGPVGPAIGPVGSGPSPFVSVSATNRTVKGCVLTVNQTPVLLNPVAMKAMQGMLDRLVMDTAGAEAEFTAPAITIEPLH